MAWEQMSIDIGSKTLNGNVNQGDNNIAIEIPYFKEFKITDKVKINKKSYTITNAVDLGERKETIAISIIKEQNNEHKQSESGKASKV